MKRALTAVVFHLLSFSLLSHAADIPAEPLATGTIQGKVVDTEERRVGGAEIAIYRSPNIRRQVDFLALTSPEGMYRINVPSGRYWMVARHRKVTQFGPLRAEDRHSGNPVEISVDAGERATADFVIGGLRETVRRGESGSEGTVALTGKVSSSGGPPVAGAYVYARRQQGGDGIPDYISFWTDMSGDYSLFLPPGRYFVGTAKDFPPPAGGRVQEFEFSANQIKVVLDIELNIQ